MSLSGALNSAVSALSSQSSALAMISDNIANAGTYGYKTVSASFESLLTGTSSSTYSAGGVAVSTVSNISMQGLLTASTTSTNMAIDGNGFFVVATGSDSANTYYTRNGEFTVDASGYLTNGDYYLQGWPTDASGNVVGGTTASALESISTTAVSSIAAATTELSLRANLPADAAVGATFTSEVEIYDSLGTAAKTSITWTKTAENEWTASYSNPTSSDGSTVLASVTSDPVVISFNSNGTLASTTPNPPTVTISGWTTGAADSSIAVNMGTAGTSSGLSQLSTGASTLSVSLQSEQDGVSFGSLSGITISNGTVYASYDNGQQRAIYKVAVATFNNPDGLSAEGSGVYSASTASGGSTLNIAGTNGAGNIVGSKLEASTTDTSREFSSMMSAQQAYSAAAQVMSAANKMYDTLISAVR
ncbi:flagellar hook protein FlgE [Phreatobacter sp. HK31-P]